MTATGTIDLRTPPPEENDRLFERHAPQALAALAGWLATDGAAPVLLLAGPAGCGRTGLLEAAARRSSRAGGEVRVLPLDLDGYEEGSDPSRFVEVQVARRWELDDEARESLRKEVLPLLPRVPSPPPAPRWSPSFCGSTIPGSPAGICCLARSPTPRGMPGPPSRRCSTARASAAC